MVRTRQRKRKIEHVKTDREMKPIKKGFQHGNQQKEDRKAMSEKEIMNINEGIEVETRRRPASL